MTATETPPPDATLSPAGNPLGFGRMLRKEDARFLRGQGHYVDDLRLPGMLYGAILRSPYAHARIVSIDTSAAEAHPKVKAVITGAVLETWVQSGADAAASHAAIAAPMLGRRCTVTGTLVGTLASSGTSIQIPRAARSRGVAS